MDRLAPDDSEGSDSETAADNFTERLMPKILAAPAEASVRCSRSQTDIEPVVRRTRSKAGQSSKLIVQLKS